MTKNKPTNFYEVNLSLRLKWLMLCRLIFSLIVISGFYYFYLSGTKSFVSLQMLGLYFFSAFIIILTLIYSLIFNFVKNKIVFSAVQIIVDTFLVTFLIYFTGIYSNVFQFFYLVIILYSSAILFGGRPFWVAGIVSIQYGLLTDLHYYGVIKCFFDNGTDVSKDGSAIFFQVFIFILSSFAVAWLSSILSIQLRRAREDLKKMDDYVRRVERLASAGEIASGFAHEIKNPMASLRGSIQLLISDMEKNRKDDLKKLGNIILRESGRLDQLVNNFLYFAKPNEVHKKKIDPALAIKELLKIFAEDKDVKNRIELFFDLEDNILIETDPDHFSQVIWNIIINGAQSCKGKGMVCVFLRKIKNFVQIDIEDTGEGIDEDIIEKVFDPFFSTKKNGSGLGLSIVARLVQLNKGRIEIKNNEDNRGLKVSLIFPVC
ncbi:MAG: ATP-binding protein [Desulforegulaceae bacterium]|nr:ATP-binding protein [Desulforegulaceae bacterium]